MKNYIVRNCPAICFPLKDNPECFKMPLNECCKDITDCLLKQIVNECKDIINQRQEIDLDNIWCHSYSDCELSEINGQCKIARRILRMLEIEECE